MAERLDAHAPPIRGRLPAAKTRRRSSSGGPGAGSACWPCSTCWRGTGHCLGPARDLLRPSRPVPGRHGRRISSRRRRPSSACSCTAARARWTRSTPSPSLQRRDGQPLPTGEKLDVFFGSPGPLMASPFAFEQHGQSGLWVSELFPHLAGVIDEVAVIKSMHAESNNHAPALFQMNTGLVRPGGPSLGSWVTYGLGTENQDLPGLRGDVRRPGRPDRRGAELGGGLHAGLVPGDALPDRGRPDPRPRARRRATAGPASAPTSTCSTTLNRDHLDDHPGESELPARIAVVRAGLPDAGRGPAGRRPLGRDRRDPAALRPRRPVDRAVRPPAPDRPPAGRAGRPVRPGLQRRGQLRRELGRPLRPREEPPPPLPPRPTGRSPGC